MSCVRARRLALVFLVAGGLLWSVHAEAQEELDPAATREYAVAVGLQGKKLFPQAVKRWQKFIAAFPKDPRLGKAHHHLGICQLQADQFTDAAKTFQSLLAKFTKFESRDAAQFNLGLALYNHGVATKKPEDLAAAAAAFAVLPAQFAKSSQTPRAVYYQAECLFQAGQVDKAVPVYEKFVQTFPQHELLADVLYALGTSQQQLRQFEPAAKTFAQFTTKFAENELADECRLRQGLCMFNLRKFDDASKLFAPLAVKKGFVFADLALLRLGQCAAEGGNRQQAVGHYQALLKDFPKTTYRHPALLELGKSLFEGEKFNEAQAPLREVVAAKTDGSAAAAYWLGRTLIKLAKPADAAPILAAAIAAYPNSPLLPHLTLTRIDALYEQPQQRKATVAMYVDFAAKRPDHSLAPQAQYMAGWAALRVEDLAAATKHADAFLANTKFSGHALLPDVLFVAGESRLLAEQPQPALAFYQQLLAKHADHPRAAVCRVRVGHCLYLTKKHAEAIQALTQAAGQVKDPALSAEARYLLGLSYAEADKVAEAVASLSASLKAKPDWPRADEVLLALAHNQRRAKKSPDATASLNQLLTRFPNSKLRDQALYHLGQICQEQKKYDEAANFFRQVVAQFPESQTAPLAAYGVGNALYEKGDFSNAVQAFSALLTKYGTSKIAAEGRYLRGLSQHRLKQYQAAITDLTEFLKSNPRQQDALEARYATGLCQIGLKQHAAAIETLASILKAKPDYARADDVLYETAYAYQALKKEKEAVDAFRQLATRLPGSPRAAESWYRVGEFHDAAEEWDKAAAAYASGLKSVKTPKLRETLLYKLGWVQYSMEKYDEAGATFQSQLKEFPQGDLAGDGRYFAGDALFRRNQWETALPLFEQVVAAKHAKFHARALYRAGASAAALRRWPVSQKHYQALITGFPKFELINETRYGLAWALQNEDKLDDARKIYEEITKATQTETAAKARFMIGECSFRQKKYNEAVEHFVEAAVYPYKQWQALATFEMARCFVELKQPGKAGETLEAFLKKYPAHEKAKAAATLLAAVKKMQ